MKASARVSPDLQVKKLVMEDGQHLKQVFNCSEPGSSERCQVETTVTKLGRCRYKPAILALRRLMQKKLRVEDKSGPYN